MLRCHTVVTRRSRQSLASIHLQSFASCSEQRILGASFSSDASCVLHILRRDEETEQPCRRNHFSSSNSKRQHAHNFGRQGLATPVLACNRQFFQNINNAAPHFRSHSLRASQQQSRQISTMLPEVFQSFSIWGGSGVLLKAFHMDGLVPHWACFSLINILVRVTLFPLVIYSAHTAARFGKVAAEIQFLVSIFQNDYKATKASGADGRTLTALLRMGLQSLRGVYKLHNINPLAAFLSPLMQLPFFIYISIDLRKMVNGRDPELAQELTDCGPSALYWISDLTEPDPFYALPILAGAAMYINLETALGKRNLAGEAASKADTGLLLKDIFQSVAVFMPCFASHNPAGMQIYLCTSFMFTTVQSVALRNERFRLMVGLPSLT